MADVSDDSVVAPLASATDDMECDSTFSEKGKAPERAAFDPLIERHVLALVTANGVLFDKTRTDPVRISTTNNITANRNAAIIGMKDTADHVAYSIVAKSFYDFFAPDTIGDETHARFWELVDIPWEDTWVKTVPTVARKRCDYKRDKIWLDVYTAFFIGIKDAESLRVPVKNMSATYDMDTGILVGIDYSLDFAKLAEYSDEQLARLRQLIGVGIHNAVGLLKKFKGESSEMLYDARQHARALYDYISKMKPKSSTRRDPVMATNVAPRAGGGFDINVSVEMEKEEDKEVPHASHPMIDELD